MSLKLGRMAQRAVFGGLASLLVSHISLAQTACPPAPVRVVRSAGGFTDYLGTEPGLPDLCKIGRPSGIAYAYFGVWQSDWPGAGEAYPAIRAAYLGPAGTTRRFVTRAVPGWQWEDIIVNEGAVLLTVDGITYQTQRVHHERIGIEGNTYHSIITSWRDLKTGVTLKTVEAQISGQSYGPDTTWEAVKVHPLP